jgi:arylsulfatase A-like enzyme
LDPADPLQVSFKEPIGNEPTGRKNPGLLRVHPSHGHDFTIVNGVSRIGYQSGGKAALWKDQTMADVFVEKARAFIEKNKADRFFLFFSTHDIHVPRLPHQRFAGTSGMGPRGDAILQLDWSVGELMSILERSGLTKNTLVIFTSDNGAVVDDGYKDEAKEKLGDHKPSGPWRGGKYSILEGGTRVPWIVRWPARVKPGVSKALMCQVDFPATFAALAGTKFESDSAPDTQNMMPALLGESEQGRVSLIEHAGGGIAIRAGDWKFIPRRPGPKRNQNTDTETGNSQDEQLYNLVEDPHETKNVAAANSEKVADLRRLLESERAN